MSTTQIHITLQELDQWSNQTFNFGRSNYKHISTFIEVMEQFPPRGLQQKVRPLVVDEGVDPEDLVFWITDPEGEIFPYNPRLSEIFKLVYEPVSVDNSVLQELLS